MIPTQTHTLANPTIGFLPLIYKHASLNCAVITVLTLAIWATGCSTAKLLPAAGTGSVIVPLRFVDVSGNDILPNDRPAKSTALFAPISGAIFGKVHGPIQPIATGILPIVSINLDVVSIDLGKFRASYGQQSATITADALASGWKIAPADTRFARVGVSIDYEGPRRDLRQTRFVDSSSKNILLLVFFDRPCRLTGTVLPSARDATKYIVDVIIDKAGLNWLEFSTNGAPNYVVIRHAPGSVRPLLVSETPQPSWVTDTNGCKVWNPLPLHNESVTWSGPCKDGYADGQGVMQWQHDGKLSTRVEATYIGGKATGAGSFVSGSGARFEGNFVDGRPSGKGVMTWPNGDRYEGEWIQGERTGVGVLTRANGDRYEGDFVDGKWSGKGVFTAVVGAAMRATGSTTSARAAARWSMRTAVVT